MKPNTTKKCAFWILFSITLSLIIVLACATLVNAGQVTLSWDANNPTPDGYRVYQRVEGGTYDYSSPAWPTDGQNHTETTCTITGLTEGTIYYFVVRAFTGADESGDSNETAHTVPSADQANDITRPSDLNVDELATLFNRLLSNQNTILEILAGGQPQNPAPTTPFCGNPDSKILHKSNHWCGAGAVLFKTKEEAISAGYRPCGICKP